MLVYALRSALWTLILLAACKPAPGPGLVTETSGGSGSGTSAGASSGDTTAPVGPCGADRVAFEGVCFRRYDLPEVPADFIASGDCDGDGRVDLIVDDFDSNTTRILYWQGPGEYTLSGAATRTTGGTSEQRILVADFDGDAQGDIGVLSTYVLEVVPLAGGEPGTPYLLPFDDLGVFVADALHADNDAVADVFIDTNDGGQLWRRDGDAFVPVGPTYTMPDCGLAADIVAADFNADGQPDIALIGSDACGDKDLDSLPPSESRVMLGHPDLSFSESDKLFAGTLPRAARAADFNGDDHLDLAVLNRRSSDVSIFLGAGDGTFASDVRASPATLLGSLAVGDLNGDGADEILVTDETALVVTSAPHIANPPVRLLEKVIGPLVAADFNDDGIMDVAAHQFAPGTPLVLLISEAP